MRSNYTLNHGQKSEENHPWKKEKLDWWWAIILIVIVATLISLVIIGFYDLPETSGFTIEINDFSSIVKSCLQYGKTFSIKDLLEHVEQLANKPQEKLHIEYNVSYYQNDTTQKTPQWIKVMIVPFNVEMVSNANTLIIKGFFEIEYTEDGMSDSNRIAKALLESLKNVTESPQRIQNRMLFIFENKEAAVTDPSINYFNNNHYKNSSSVLINLNSIEGFGDVMIQTHTNSLKLLETFYKAYNHPLFCMLCGDISKYDIFQLEHKTEHITGREISNIDLLYVYGKQDETIEILSRKSKYFSQRNLNGNILSLVRQLDALYALGGEYEPRDMAETIFFDFFGIFMVIYSETDAIVINVVVSIVGLTTIAYSIFLMQNWATISFTEIIFQFIITLGVYLGSIAVGSGFTILMAYLYGCYKHLITWIPKHWLVFGIYFCPFIFTISILPNLYLGWRKFKLIPLRFGIILFQHINCILFIIAILVLTGLSVRMAFVMVSGVAFYTLSIMINVIFKLHNKYFVWIFPILIGQMFPIIFVTYLMLIFYSVYIPASDRPTTSSTIQLLLALSAIGFSMLMLGFLIPLISLFRKSKTILSGFLVVMLIFIILMFTDMFLA